MELRSFDVTTAADGVDLEKALDTGDYETRRVTITHADQLVAEQAGPRYGMGAMTDRPLAYTTLWCWCAYRRMGLDVPEFPLWKDRVLSIDLVKQQEALDPTTPGPGTGSP